MTMMMMLAIYDDADDDGDVGDIDNVGDVLNLPTETTPLLRLPLPVSVDRGKCFTLA